MNLLIIPSKRRKEYVQIDETIDKRQFVICVVFFAFILELLSEHTRREVP
jgi:hypothetical protein